MLTHIYKELGANISIFLNKKCNILLTSTSKYEVESLNVLNACRYGVNILAFDDYNSILSHLNISIDNKQMKDESQVLFSYNKIDKEKPSYLQRERGELSSENKLSFNVVEDEPPKDDSYSSYNWMFNDEEDNIEPESSGEPLTFNNTNWIEDTKESNHDETCILPFHDQEDDKSSCLKNIYDEDATAGSSISWELDNDEKYSWLITQSFKNEEKNKSSYDSSIQCDTQLDKQFLESKKEYNNQREYDHNTTTSSDDVKYNETRCIDSSDEFPMELLEIIDYEDIDVPSINNPDDVIIDENKNIYDAQDQYKIEDSKSETDFVQEADKRFEQNVTLTDDYEPIKKKKLYHLDSNKKLVKNKIEEPKETSKFPKPSSMKYSWVGIVKGTESTKEKKIQPSYAGQKVFFGGFKYDDLKDLSLPVEKQIELYLKKYKKRSLKSNEKDLFKQLNEEQIEELVNERIKEIKRIVSSFGNVFHMEDHLKKDGYIFVIYKNKKDAENVVKMMKILNSRQAIVKRSKEYLKSINKDPIVSPSHNFYVRWPKYYMKKLENIKIMRKQKKKNKKK